MSVIRLDNFVSESERTSLMSWCEVNPALFGDARTANGETYQLRKISNSNAVVEAGGFPEVAYRVQERIRERFPILGVSLSRFLDGMTVGILLPGGEFAPHVDNHFRQDGLVCVGVNVLLAAPESGGVVKVDGVEQSQQVGDALVYLLSEQIHGVSQVVGNAKRVLWSWRFMVDLAAWNTMLSTTSNFIL
jgi:hypothetical protein